MVVDINGVANRTEGTIYAGDSRFSGMEMYLKKGEGYIVALSVNPTNKKSDTLNDEINQFNLVLSNSDLEYVDLCNHLRQVGFETVDGVHYNKATYTEIWNEINWYLAHDNIDEQYTWNCSLD